VIHINFVCEQNVSSTCDMLTACFEQYSETWQELLAFAQEQGWAIEGGPHQDEVQCWCPAHAKERLPKLRIAFVNGRAVSIDKPVLSYEDVVEIAGFAPGIYTVTYHYLGSPSKILSPGMRISIRDDITFGVHDTSNA